MKRLLPLFLFLILVATGCNPPTQGGASGIEGQVLLGPNCTVVRPNDTTCVNKPYQATLVVLTTSGQEVTRFSSDENGNFRVNLEPGDYVLRPEPPNGAFSPRGRDQPFSVLAGQFTKLMVTYDSGMR